MLDDVLAAAGAAAIVGVVLWATDAYPQETIGFGDGYAGGQFSAPGVSTVTIGKTSKPGALADVTFENVAVNDDADTGKAGVLRFNGIEVMVEFTYNAGAAGEDRVILAPPEGVICHPSCEMTILEGATATVTLYDIASVGM